MSHIPPRQNKVEDKERRFYVCAPSSIYLQLQQEAIQRGTDLWTLGGSVLTAWLEAGFPSPTSGASSARSTTSTGSGAKPAPG